MVQSRRRAMRGPAAMVFAAACAAGCHSAPPALYPFLPRTRIPPPGTGAATGSPDAYPYTGSAPAYSPPTNVPGGAGSNGLFAPPGGYPFQPSSPAPATGGYAPIPGPVNRSQSQAAPSQAAQVVRASHVTTADDE